MAACEFAMSAQAWAYELELQRRYYEEIVMPKVSEMIQSKFLRKEDFDEDRVLTIKTVKLEDMPGDSGDQKWVLYFREEAKGMALNVTTIRVLENAFGDDSDNWVGKKVKVYVDPNVSFGGKVVGGLRLMPPRKQAEAPAVKQPAVGAGEFDDDIPFDRAAQPRVSSAANRKASMYVTEFIKCAALKDDSGAVQLWDELKADQETATVVWGQMKTNNYNEFRWMNEKLRPKGATGERFNHTS